jgi:hypothetical protein
MLAKIIKYEMLATGRIFVLLYAALLVVAILNAVLLPLDALSVSETQVITSPTRAGLFDILYSTAVSISVFLYSVLVVVCIALTIIINVVRFYRMLGDEGYLWLTLPVSSAAHIIGKLLVSFIWFIASSAVIVISLGLLFIKTGWITELPNLIGEINTISIASGINIWFWLVFSLVLLVITWLSSMLQFYAAIAIGPNLVKSRLGGSVLAYFIMYVAQQIISFVIVIIGLFMIGSELEAMEKANTIVGCNPPEAFFTSLNNFGLLTLGGSCILCVLLGVVFFLLTRHFMTKKLNLA